MTQTLVGDSLSLKKKSNISCPSDQKVLSFMVLFFF